jgi:hypothetical protein
MRKLNSFLISEFVHLWGGCHKPCKLGINQKHSNQSQALKRSKQEVKTIILQKVSSEKGDKVSTR